MAQLLDIILSMKIFAFTNDGHILNYLSKEDILAEHKVLFSKGNNNPLDVISDFCTIKPSLLIYDDDFSRPNTVQILHSIKKIDKNVSILFLTSDTSIELGREITPAGVHYYGIKPVEEKDFFDALNSIIQMKIKLENNSLS